MKWSQICPRIELCRREIILCFEMYLFLDSWIHVHSFKKVPKFLAIRGCKCKNHTIPILMHQMYDVKRPISHVFWVFFFCFCLFCFVFFWNLIWVRSIKDSDIAYTVLACTSFVEMGIWCIKVDMVWILHLTHGSRHLSVPEGRYVQSRSCLSDFLSLSQTTEPVLNRLGTNDS
jgi:hypothetical protein